MTQYGDWTYTYDAENRLVGAQNGTTRMEFIYDALGRRVAKRLYQYNSLSKHERYVYDGMKLLATYNAKSSFAKINSFLWQPFGLDVPLIMTYNSTVYGYLVDANKNVLGLFNPSKTRVATYLYGPFGQKFSESGTIAANNPLQFSSEQFDADLNLVYYNFRYYFPVIGKWLTKDPIGERGGWNLYTFCGNNAVNTWDALGMYLAAFDGTANTEDDHTNIFLMYSAYDKPVSEKKYYHGIGNSIDYPWYRIITRTWQQATGSGIDNKIEIAMKDLSNYIDNQTRKNSSQSINDIDVIGFSRGAITAVRFVKRLEEMKKKNDKIFVHLCNIRFLGLFDPVEGGIRSASVDTISSFVSHVSTAYSWNEARTVFQPTYYYHTSSGKSATSPVINSIDNNSIPVFFYGGHADVGGGYAERGLANITLDYMINAGINAGAPFSWSSLNNAKKNNVWQKD